MKLKCVPVKIKKTIHMADSSWLIECGGFVHGSFLTLECVDASSYVYAHAMLIG